MPQSTASILKEKHSARNADSPEPDYGRTAEQPCAPYPGDAETRRKDRRLRQNEFPHSLDRNKSHSIRIGNIHSVLSGAPLHGPQEFPARIGNDPESVSRAVLTGSGQFYQRLAFCWRSKSGNCPIHRASSPLKLRTAAQTFTAETISLDLAG